MDMMRQYITKKRIFAVVFIICLLAFSAYNMYTCRKALWDKALKQFKEKKIDTKALESTMQDKILWKYAFIEIHGALQKAMGKQEVGNFTYVKDKNGFMLNSGFYMEDDPRILEYAVRIKRLKDLAERHGTKLLFVVTPPKYNKDYTVLGKGMPVNDPEGTTRELLMYLHRLGIETLDLSEYLPNEEIPYDEAFFRTDHHWTVPASFRATQILADTIKDRFGEDLDPDGRYLAESLYEKKLYRKGMLGAMGRRAGVIYSGLEDCMILFPKFTGNYKWKGTTDSGRTKEKEGSFTEALMDLDNLSDDNNYYINTQYGTYLNGLYSIDNVENLDNTDGPSIFMIRDSYFSPVISFLMPAVSRVDAVWALFENEDFHILHYLAEQYRSGKAYDYMIIEIYPYNIEDKAFRFFRESR